MGLDGGWLGERHSPLRMGNGEVTMRFMCGEWVNAIHPYV